MTTIPAPANHAYTPEEAAEWLENIMDEDDIEAIRGMPVAFIEKMYPNLSYGPQGDDAKALLQKVLDDLEEASQKNTSDAGKRIDLLTTNADKSDSTLKIRIKVQKLILMNAPTARQSEPERFWRDEIPANPILVRQNNLFSVLENAFTALFCRDLIWETDDAFSTITWDDYYALTAAFSKAYGKVHPDDRDVNNSSDGVIRL
jgi:hypothetical protein